MSAPKTIVGVRLDAEDIEQLKRGLCMEANELARGLDAADEYDWDASVRSRINRHYRAAVRSLNELDGMEPGLQPAPVVTRALTALKDLRVFQFIREQDALSYGDFLYDLGERVKDARRRVAWDAQQGREQ